MEAQSQTTSGLSLEGLRPWMARATTSLPVPVSPVMRTLEKYLAMFSTSPKISSIVGLRLIRPSKSYLRSSFFSRCRVSRRSVALAGDPPEDVAEDVALVGPGDEVGRPGVDDVEGGLPADGFAADEDVDQVVEFLDLLQDQEPGGEGVAGVDEDDADAVLADDGQVVVVGLREEDVEVGRDGGLLDGLVEREVVRDDQEVGLCVPSVPVLFPRRLGYLIKWIRSRKKQSSRMPLFRRRRFCPGSPAGPDQGQADPVPDLFLDPDDRELRPGRGT